MATAGPMMPTKGTSTDGNQAAAKSPVMTRTYRNLGYCIELFLASLGGLETAT